MHNQDTILPLQSSGRFHHPSPGPAHMTACVRARSGCWQHWCWCEWCSEVPGPLPLASVLGYTLKSLSVALTLGLGVQHGPREGDSLSYSEQIVYLPESVPSSVKGTLASTSQKCCEGSMSEMCKTPSIQHSISAMYLLVPYSFHLLLSYIPPR